MGHHPAGGLKWQKGRLCDAGTCVEVAVRDEQVLLRSSVEPQVVLSLSREEWREFLTGAQEGLFDQL